MLKSKIFQKNIVINSHESDKALSFENCNVEISENHIKIVKNDIELLNSELTFQENDFSTITYLGHFDNSNKFRIIRPTGVSLGNIRNRFNCETAFSVASINPNGYAIHFILIKENDNQKIAIVNKGKKEQIQRLIDGSIMAIQFNLKSNFIDYSKRILNLIDNIDELDEYQNSNKFITFIHQNINSYTSAEVQKINT